MDLMALARLQFGATTVYHFLFVPLTLGLSFIVAWLQYRHYKTGDDTYDYLTRYFGTLFLINFAMGVVTGIVQEFQFGMNWSNYSRFVGDIFGAPLAVEALAAFFLESTFLGLWIFGRERLSRKVHLATIWLVAFASTLSAFWIIVANSFMQAPVGFVIRQTANGPRAEMTDFLALLGNAHVWIQFPHTVLAGFTTGAVFVLAVIALNMLYGKKGDAFKRILKPMAVFGLVSLVLTIGVGDAQGKYISKYQPMKMAAAEALWNSQDKAPLTLFALIDEKKQEKTLEIKVPYMLSILAFNDPNATVQGINNVQAEYTAKYGAYNYIPPVTVTFWSFRVMVFLGSFLMLVLLVALVKARDMEKYPLLLKMLIFALPIPYLCNTAGWIMTEIGRQPWLVQGVLKLENGISTSGAVTPVTVAVSLLGFVALYGVLAVFDVYLMARHIRKGFDPETAKKDAHEEVANVW